jgi:hypothetical protein
MSITFTAINAAKPTTVTFDDGRTVQHPSTVRLPDDLYLNLCNVNAAALLSVLGLDPNDPCGAVEIPVARRAIIKANATDRLDRFTRPDETVYGEPREGDDGVVTLRPLRIFSQGLDRNALQERLDRFSKLVEAAAVKGATHIQWS